MVNKLNKEISVKHALIALPIDGVLFFADCTSTYSLVFLLRQADLVLYFWGSYGSLRCLYQYSVFQELFADMSMLLQGKITSGNKL